MQKFETITLPDDPTILAPDRAEVRMLSVLAGGSFTYFRCPPDRRRGPSSTGLSRRSGTS